MSVPLGVSGHVAMKEGMERVEWGSSMQKSSIFAALLPEEKLPAMFEISNPLASLNDRRFSERFIVSASRTFRRAVSAMF